MNFLRNILGELLPFGLFSHRFMANALIAIIFVSILFGLLGTMIVNNKLSFFSDALGHSTIFAIAASIFLRINANYLSLSLVIFGVLFSITIIQIKYMSKTSVSTVISILSSVTIAFGLIFMSKNGGMNKYANLFIGDILTISDQEIYWLILIFIFILSVWRYIYPKILAISIDSTIASSRGISPKLIETLFTCLIALIVSYSVRWIGVLIINALMIIPAASARNIAQNIKQYTIISVVISMISSITGLILSYIFGLPSGPSIVVCCTAFYAISICQRHFKH